jgi:hypothetical protein
MGMTKHLHAILYGTTVLFALAGSAEAASSIPRTAIEPVPKEWVDAFVGAILVAIVAYLVAYWFRSKRSDKTGA